ncbi:ribosome modulation factor [Methylobacterium symbioticum]|uniref:ribosome modulation factor n=1 Tax=Methylobacterium symbioticum TaxID=2584084 RepID=UPI0027B9ADC9|nr:Rmf/CrpP family protein [Methylobacterium symbioticum]
MQVIKQGARARILGRPRDACPYPADSRERRAWFEGFDGSAWDHDAPLPDPDVTASAGTSSAGNGRAALHPVRAMP